MGKSLYDILELEEHSTPTLIKNAYNSLKLQYEQMLPESDPRHISTTQYRAIAEAYQILSDPKRRDLYDQKLISNRHAHYATTAAHADSPSKKFIFVLLFVFAAGAAYAYYQKTRADKVRENRELLRLELEKQQALLKQEEANLEAENARLEQERILQARRDEAKRAYDINQSRYESRQYAADVSRMQNEERRRLQEVQREQARMDAERQRQERMRPATPSGPMVVR